MILQDLNKMNREEAVKLLMSCCGSSNWVSYVMKKFPFKSEKELVDVSLEAWYDQCRADDWTESFSHHPKIGDTKSLAEKFAGKEQAGVATATKETIESLAKANKEYESVFGFIFIVYATGKSAEELLRLLQDRRMNTAEEELRIAMGEQMKITILRLQKLLTESDWSFLKPSQLTTHVLDTSIGKPGKDITIQLKSKVKGIWQTLAQGVTNSDGRIGDLLPAEKNLNPGNYQMVFKTGNYFTAQRIKGFYPEVAIEFTVIDATHYHVPLLINPFGYSTYRGS